jgi:hypothetical protein
VHGIDIHMLILVSFLRSIGQLGDPGGVLLIDRSAQLKKRPKILSR